MELAWVGGYEKAIREDRAQEAAFMAQNPPALDRDVIRKLHVRLDAEQDMVFEFENGERRYALLVVLRDHKALGWKECQALADCMRIAARGSCINNKTFVDCCEQLKQKYGSVRGPVTEQRHLVCLVTPGPGELRNKDPEVLSHAAVKFDDDGDFSVEAISFRGRVYTITLCLPTKHSQRFSNLDSNAFIDVMAMLETGDPMDSITYVSYIGVLRSKYNFVQYGRTGDHLMANVAASRVENKTPIDTVILQAIKAKYEQLNAAGSPQPRSAAGPPRCPYPNMTYTCALEESGQAQVYAGTMADGRRVAVKVFKGDRDSAAETYRTELRMLLKMPEHRNVIEVLEFFETPEPALVTRLVEGEGDLLAYMKNHGKFEEREGRRIAAEIADGICHLHKCGIVHRDLKTPNILLQKSSSGRLRPIVIDLGLGSTLSKKKGSSTMSMQELVTSMARTGLTAQTDGTKGTLLWMAPEMVANQEWSEKTDVFAFGIILWELFSAEIPYSQLSNISSAVDLLFKICNGVRPDMSKVSHVGSSMRRLIEECWDPDPRRRPSMRRVLDLLRGNDPVAIFRSIDTDCSKTLNFGELVQFLQRYAPQVKPGEMHSIFEAIDEDNSGDITYPEFLQFWEVVQKNGLANALTLCQRAKSRRKTPSNIISHDFSFGK